MSAEAVPRHENGRRSFLRHPGLTQAGEICSFEQGADFRYSPISWPAQSPRGLQAGDARIARGQSTGLREFGRGAFGLAFKSVGRSKPSVWVAVSRNSADRLFEPNDRLVSMRQ